MNELCQCFRPVFLASVVAAALVAVTGCGPKDFVIAERGKPADCTIVCGEVPAKFGGDDFRFGGGLGSCHTFDRLCNPDIYFDAHPEYFSMVKGKRLKERTQLCLTNPDVLDIVTSNVLERIRCVFASFRDGEWVTGWGTGKKILPDTSGRRPGGYVRKLT